MGEDEHKLMEGRKASVADGNRVALVDREDEGTPPKGEEESCSVEQGLEDLNLRSSFSSEITEDTVSSSSSSSLSSSFSGALLEFSDLTANLPVKRGLSRYSDGKSQSFTCLGRAKSLEDLTKKDHSPYNKRIKSLAAKVKSADQWHHRIGRSCSPKATVSKKVPRNTLLPSMTGNRAMASSTGTAIGRRISNDHPRNFCKWMAKEGIGGDRSNRNCSSVS